MADEKAMGALADYLADLGGGRHLLSGWRVRIAVRVKASAGQKPPQADSYFYNPLGVKYRSKVDVARHLGLVGVGCTKQVGTLSADGIDSKLWIGASAAGWAVHSTTDNRYTYTAPDGTRFKRKVEALGWNPLKRVKLKMALPASYANDCFDLNSSEDEAEVEEDEDDDVRPTAEPTLPAPATALTSCGSGTQVMHSILEQLWLGQYTEPFDRLGYDDPEWLATLGQAALLKVAVEAGMKTGHARKFADLFQKACRSALANR